MRTRARLIATIAVCFWLSLAAVNHLAANQRSYKPTEEDIRIKKELERLEQQIKEGEKFFEKYRKQDEEQAKRIAHEDEARSTRKFQLKLIFGGIFVLATLVFRMFKRQERNPRHQPTRSSQIDSVPWTPDASGQSAEQQTDANEENNVLRHAEQLEERAAAKQHVDAKPETKHIPKRQKSLVYRYEFNSGLRISIVVDRTSNVIHFENCYSRSRYFRFSLEEHFVCPVADLTSFHTYHVKNKGGYLVLKTRTGTAQVKDWGDNFSSFHDALSQAFPSKHRSFHESSAEWLFLLVGLATFALGHSLIPSHASNAVHFAINVPLVVASVLSTYLWVDSLGRK